MFYYFGRKGRLANLYHSPSPEHPLVIEPFAGSMAYSLNWKPMKAIGYEIDLEIHEVWRRICKLTPEEINDYPEPTLREIITDRWCMLASGSHGTAKAKSYKWTDRMARELKKQKKMAAKNVKYSKDHIEYYHGSFSEAPDIYATWFIDPPYQNVRRGYRGDQLDYEFLGDWCRSRKGLVIVCEQEGANWLPFQPLVEIKGVNNKWSSEVVWVNQ